jgi:hypothetical protein
MVGTMYYSIGRGNCWSFGSFATALFEKEPAASVCVCVFVACLLAPWAACPWPCPSLLPHGASFVDVVHELVFNTTNTLHLQRLENDW